ncbi:hypothetical protein AAC387_Pa03g0751 [Persea americana]
MLGREDPTQCLKGLGHLSKPYLEAEEETPSRGEDEELELLQNNAKALLEPLRINAKALPKPSSEPEEDNLDVEEDNSWESSFDGETDEQEVRDTEEREETVKWLLEGEKSRGRAKTPSFSFGEGEVEEEHRGEEIGEGKEKDVSEVCC